MIIGNRPVFLNLLQFRFPIGAVASIGHRVSGALMVLTVPFLVYLLDMSLSGPEGFESARTILDSSGIKLLLFLLLWALLHHLLAGIRHLLLDLHIGIEKESSRKTATGLIFVAPVLAVIMLGVLP